MDIATLSASRAARNLLGALLNAPPGREESKLEDELEALDTAMKYRRAGSGASTGETKSSDSS